MVAALPFRSRPTVGTRGSVSGPLTLCTAKSSRDSHHFAPLLQTAFLIGSSVLTVFIRLLVSQTSKAGPVTVPPCLPFRRVFPFST